MRLTAAQTIAALACSLALVSSCAAPESASAGGDPPSAATSPGTSAAGSAATDDTADADTALLIQQAGELLDTALVQQEDPRIAADAGPILDSARTALVTAQQRGARRALVAPALSTIDALQAWRALQESGAADEVSDPSLGDSRKAWRAAFEQAAVTQLAAARDASQGRWPQATVALLTVLFEAGRNEQATNELADALRCDPSLRQVHALARTWRDSITDPHALLPLLQGVSWAGDPTAPDGGASRLAITRGYLRLSLGIAIESIRDAQPGSSPTADADATAALFEQAADDLEAGRAAAVKDVSDWELLSRITDCLVNAGRLHTDLAEAALPSGGLGTAGPELVAAERDYGGALIASPGDADATAGLALTGDIYYRGGSQEAARDFFGRVAQRFDNPEWWNNYAFFCRETKQYEQSYAAYEKCIALAPDNARWVNDTGLILLYHLHRDLDHAEALFHRSFELGKAVCDNPFASPDARDENLAASGDALLNLAQLSVQRGDKAKARGYVEQLLTLSPDRPDAQKLKADIDQLPDAPPAK